MARSTGAGMVRGWCVAALVVAVSGCPERYLGESDGGTTEEPGAGLPCDVAQVLVDNCTSCHVAGSTAAPMSLATLDALQAGSPTNRTVTAGAMSVTRMNDAVHPMPPGNPLPADQIATISNWVAAGMPSGTCDANVDAGPPTCTTGSFWEGVDDGDKDMHPGMACIECHERKEPFDNEPYKTIGGTVYATYRELDDCNGTNGAPDPVSVVITDNNGVVTTLRVRSGSGNFGTSQSVAFPITAKVVSASGKVRQMVQAVDTGDCNTCHSETGTNDAPGRIRLPQ